MVDQPELSADLLIQAVSIHYGFNLTTLAVVPLGHDVRAWTYHADTSTSGAYLLKLRHGSVHPASLRVPRLLVDRGATHVVAPVPTRNGQLAVQVGPFMLSLFPFIAGVSGLAHGLQERHWGMYGAALRQVHDAPLAQQLDVGVPREEFTVAQLFRRLRQAPWTEVVAALDAHSTRPTCIDTSERELEVFWQQQRVEIMALADRFASLGRELRAAPPRFVLCHADVHPNNVLIAANDHLWIVDWDEVLIAPKECDLMMGVGGLGNYSVGRRETSWFLNGYGGTAVDPIALAYYRHARALGDIGANVEVVLSPASSTAAKRTGMQWLRLLFAPGYIVSLARQAQRLF